MGVLIVTPAVLVDMMMPEAPRKAIVLVPPRVIGAEPVNSRPFWGFSVDALLVITIAVVPLVLVSSNVLLSLPPIVRAVTGTVGVLLMRIFWPTSIPVTVAYVFVAVTALCSLLVSTCTPLVGL